MKKALISFDEHHFLADVELDKTNTLLAEILRGLELRKRSYFVNMPTIVYIIGRRMIEYLAIPC